MTTEVARHRELETPGGLVYAQIEDWRDHPDQPSRKVLALQPAEGSGEPTGQPCHAERLPLGHPRVDRLLRLLPHLADLVEEARAAQPEPTPVPTGTQLQDQVNLLTRQLEELPDVLLRKFLAAREAADPDPAPARKSKAAAEPA